MEYSKLVSITGMQGLYELINTKGDGAIVRSLEDKTTHFISSRIHNFTQLESIEVFTQQDSVNLVEVFHAMEKSNEPLPDEKDMVATKKFFQKFFPEMDFEKVYDSDRKKMLRWFTFLKKHNIEIKLSEPVAEPVPAETKKESEGEKRVEEKSSKKSAEDSERPSEKKSSKAASSKKTAGKPADKTEKKSAKKKADKKSDKKKKK